MATPDYSIGLAVDAKQMADAIIRQQGALKKIYDKALASATEANFSRKKFKGLEESMSAATKEMAQQQLKLTRLQLQLQNKNLSDEMKKRLAAQLKEVKIRRKFLEDQAKEALESARKLAAKEKEQHEKRLKATSTISRWAKGSSGAGGGLNALLKQLGSGDISGAAGTLGRGAKGVKGALENKVARGGVGADAAHATLKIVNKLGSSLAALGPALAAIGAMAGSLMFLVTVFLEADKLVKEMNSSLLKSNVVASDLGASWENLEERLEEVRGSFNNLSFMNSWKVLPKEAMKIVDAYGAAGVKVSDFTAGLEKAADRQEKLRGVTETALTYANLVGMTGEEVATKMGEYMDDLGMSLKSVRDGFSNIYRVANESGYSTKKFFGMVLQASSGLSMYNVRLEQTADLLSKMTSALGLKRGFELFQKTMSTMQGRSVTDSAKAILLAKDGTVGNEKDISRDLDYKMGNFLLSLQESVSTHVFSAAAKAAGVDLDLSSGEKLAESMKKLTDVQLTLLRGQLNARATDKPFRDFVRKFMDDAQHFVPGALKGADAVAQAGAASRGSPQYQFIRMMKEVAGVAALAGQKPEHMRDSALVAAEKLGYSNVQELGTLLHDLTANLEYMVDRAAKAGSANNISAEDMQHLVKTFGYGIRNNAETGVPEVVRGTIDSFGKVVLDTGKAITSIEDSFYANESVFAKLAAKGDSQEVLLSKQIAANTNEAAKMLEAIKDGILLNIYKAIQTIINFIAPDKLKEASKTVRSMFAEDTRKQTKLLREVQDSKRAAEQYDPKDIQDPQQKAAFVEHMKRLVEDEAKILQNLDRIRSAETDYMSAMSRDPDKMAEDVREALKHTSAGRSGVRDGGGVLLNQTEKSDEQKLRDKFGVSVAKIEDTQDPRASGMSGLFANAGRYVRSAESAQQMNTLVEKLVREAQKTTSQTSHLDSPEVMKIMDALKAFGVQNVMERRDLSGELQSGRMAQGRLEYLKANPGLAEKILGMNEGLHPSSRAVLESALQKPAANDLLMSMGGGKINFAHRIDSQDQLGFMAKPGGALSKGGGGGTTVVNNNFWEGKGAFNSMRQLEKAKGRYN